MARRIFCPLWIIAMAVVYLFTGTGAALMVLCASVVLPVGGILSAMMVCPRLEMKLELPASIQKGEAIQGELHIWNRTPVPVLRAILQIEMQNTLTGEARILPSLFSIGPMGRTRVPFEFQSAHCGRFSFQCAELTVYDLFGLAPRRRAVQVTEKRLIPPELFPLRVHLTGSENPLGDKDSIHFNRRGQDWSEPFQVRDYQEGDGLKRIHWKLSQKLDRYIVAEPSQTVDRALLVLWDQGALAEEAGPGVPDALAESVVSLCLALTQEEIPFSLAWSNGAGADVEIQDVSSMDDLYGIIPQILCTSLDEGRQSCVSACIHMLSGRRYPLIAYFGGAAEDLGELSALGKVSAFLCSEDAGLETTGTESCKPFSPLDYKQSLSDVVI